MLLIEDFEDVRKNAAQLQPANYRVLDGNDGKSGVDLA